MKWSKILFACALHLFTTLFLISLLQQSLLVESQKASANQTHPDGNTTKAPAKQKGGWSDYCQSNADCAPTLFCQKSACVPAFGFQLDTKTNQSVAIQCTKAADCVAPNSKCSNQKKCECSEPFQLEPYTQQCKIPIGVISTKLSDCGATGTVLLNGMCECQFGFVQDLGNGNFTFTCSKFSCLDNLGCNSRFDVNQNGTWCRKSEKSGNACECFPPSRFRLDKASQSCKPVEELTKSSNLSSIITCDSKLNADEQNKTCGSNAFCMDSKCVCDFAHISYLSKATPGLGCRKFQCLTHEECNEIVQDSKCNHDQKCVCRSPFKLDDSGLKCVKDTNWFAMGIIVAGAIMAVGPLVFFIAQKLACGGF